MRVKEHGTFLVQTGHSKYLMIASSIAEAVEMFKAYGITGEERNITSVVPGLTVWTNEGE